MSHTRDIEPWRVVIAGGGVAAIEAAMALTDLGEHALDIVLIAPGDHFTLRAHAVREPFGGAPSPTFAIASIARELGATFVRDRVVGVRPGEDVVVLEHRDPVPYDALILAIGTTRRAMDPRVLTFGGPSAVRGIRDVVGDLTAGRATRAAFVVPPGTSWPVPAYELALQVRGHTDRGDVALITPETTPLGLFGDDPSQAVAALLADAGVEVHLGAIPSIGRDGQSVGLGVDGPWLRAERIVALPVLDVPRLPGIPHDHGGFIPVDDHGRVLGMHRVYAAGDATDQPIKQGGLAAQQAYASARHIASAVGGLLDPEPFRPVLRGRLITGGRDRFLRHAQGDRDRATLEELWWPPAKVVGHYLAPWIAAQDVPRRWTVAPADGIVVEQPLVRRLDPDVLGLDPYSPTARR